MKNFIQPGDQLTLAAPYAVASGAGALVGSIFGVASNAAANGEDVVLFLEGVYEIAKATGEAWTVGAKVYWNNTNKNLTTTSAGNTLVGAAIAAALTGDTTGIVYLDGAIR